MTQDKQGVRIHHFTVKPLEKNHNKPKIEEGC